jgi:hypothetical protein
MDIDGIKKVLSYDPEAGSLTWLCDRGRAKAGSVAGTIHKRSGYVHIEIFGRYYSAHRLAWALHYGREPEDQIDHINKNRSDNRICNLREASNGQNRANTKSSSVHGLKGVSLKPWLKDRPWEARITKDRKVISLGCFATKEEAHEAYCKKAKELHGEFFSP